MGEQTIPVFDTLTPLADTATDLPHDDNGLTTTLDQTNVDQLHIPGTPTELHRSTWIPQLSKASLQSAKYQRWEITGKDKGKEWATIVVPGAYPEDYKDIIACLIETKASHHIPQSYQHAMVTDPDRWMISMQVEMDTLKTKHTWDLVKPYPEQIL